MQEEDWVHVFTTLHDEIFNLVIPYFVDITTKEYSKNLSPFAGYEYLREGILFIYLFILGN